MPIDVLGLTVYEDPHLGKLRITQNTLDTLGYGKKSIILLPAQLWKIQHNSQRSSMNETMI